MLRGNCTRLSDKKNWVKDRSADEKTEAYFQGDWERKDDEDEHDGDLRS